jgi:hypothetical protein
MPSIIQADQLKSADGNTTYLNSGTLSNLTFPAGHVVQVQQVLGSGSAMAVPDNNAWNDIVFGGGNLSVTFNTKQDNSKFFCLLQGTAVFDNASERMSFRWDFKSGGSTQGSDVGNTLFYMILSGTGTAYLPLTAQYLYTSSYSANTSITVQGKCWADNGTVDLLSTGTTMTVWEITT